MADTLFVTVDSKGVPRGVYYQEYLARAYVEGNEGWQVYEVRIQDFSVQYAFPPIACLLHEAPF